MCLEDACILSFASFFFIGLLVLINFWKVFTYKGNQPPVDQSWESFPDSIC